MNLSFTKEQQMVQQMVRDFTKNEVSQAVERMEEEDRFPNELIKKMGNLGLMGIPIPEQYGGSGMDVTSYIICIHELSKVSAALGVILSVHTSVCSNPILLFGTDEQKQRYLPKLAAGQYLGAFALTESGAGSDAANIKMTADETDSHFTLNGSKMFITNGLEADVFITFARTKNLQGSDGISAFIVDKTADGLKIGKKEKKLELFGSSTVELIFDQCIVPKQQLLGKKGDGFKMAMKILNVGRIGIAAQALGIAEGALEQSIQYAKEREQFGKSIAQHQAVAFKLADMKMEVEAARLLVYQAAHMVEQGLPCKKEVSIAKLFASKTAVKVASEAIQIHGGYGYTKDYPVERFYRDAKVTEIYEGTSEIQRMVISSSILK